jgi:putative FmdB family regulatory protein
MPLYEYKCNDGHITQKVKPVSEYRDPVPCDTCGGETRRTYDGSFFLIGYDISKKLKLRDKVIKHKIKKPKNEKLRKQIDSQIKKESYQRKQAGEYNKHMYKEFKKYGERMVG